MENKQEEQDWTDYEPTQSQFLSSFRGPGNEVAFR